MGEAWKWLITSHASRLRMHVSSPLRIHCLGTETTFPYWSSFDCSSNGIWWPLALSAYGTSSFGACKTIKHVCQIFIWVTGREFKQTMYHLEQSARNNLQVKHITSKAPGQHVTAANAVSRRTELLLGIIKSWWDSSTHIDHTSYAEVMRSCYMNKPPLHLRRTAAFPHYRVGVVANIPLQ
jgi:hypothetical protein